MQLFAIDQKKHLVAASHAEKKIDYGCRECGGIVRVRGGFHMQNHFFHLALSASCGQNQKSLAHIQVQHYIKSLFPKGDVELERQFQEIGRIADVLWERGKLVFEVQCSPIAMEEVKSRNRDYESLGYTVVWILHENRFNRWKVSAAEVFLRTSTYYFTNIDSLGRGCIYDQIELLLGGTRRIFRKVFDVKLNQFHPLFDNDRSVDVTLPNQLKTRLSQWPLYFSGDVVDLWRLGEGDVLLALASVAAQEKSRYQRSIHPLFKYLRKALHHTLIKPYKILFQMVLEKFCN